MKTKNKLTALALTAILLATVFVAPMQAQTPIATAATPKSTKLAAPDLPKVDRNSNTSLKLTWKKVEGAQGYEIYRKLDYKTNEYEKIKTLKGNSTTKFIDKNLRERTFQTYKVRAYKIVNKKKQYSPFSYWVSAMTYRQGDKKVNVGSIKPWGWAKTVTFPQWHEETFGSCPEDQVESTCNWDFYEAIPSTWSKAKGKK